MKRNLYEPVHPALVRTYRAFTRRLRLEVRQYDRGWEWAAFQGGGNGLMKAGWKEGYTGEDRAMAAADRWAAIYEAQNEKEFMEAVIDLAKQCGWLVFHPYDNRRSEPGFPDLTLVRDKMLIMAELKTERGKVSQPQQEWGDALSQVLGVEYRLWRPSDLPEIEAMLTYDGYAKREEREALG